MSIGGVTLPDPPRPWGVDQIRAMPEFGGSQGWFYGLVIEVGDDDEERLVLSEIIPGFGYTYLDATELDPETWLLIRQDLANYGPEKS